MAFYFKKNRTRRIEYSGKQKDWGDVVFHI